MNQYEKLKKFWLLNERSYSKLKLSQHTKLSSWIVRQRREYQKFRSGTKSTMTDGRIHLLEEIGFDWSPRETNWNSRIRELEEYKKLNGNCLVRWFEMYTINEAIDFDAFIVFATTDNFLISSYLSTLQRSLCDTKRIRD